MHHRDLTRGSAGAALLVHGKGGKRRIVPVSDDLAAAITGAGDRDDHDDHDGFAIPAVAGADGYVFPGADDGHLSPRYVGDLMAGALPGHWTAHTLRHRFATRAHRGSRNLRAVQTLLGHSSVATMERYTAVDSDEVRAAAMAAGCLRRRK